MRTLLPTSFVAGALIAMLIGCAPQPGTTVQPTPTPSAAAQEDPDAEGCEHLAGGKVQAITAASAEATESIPTVNEYHTRYDLTLVASDSQKVGKVRFNSADAGDYLVFLDRDVPLLVKDAQGQVVTLEASATGSVRCDIVKGRHLVELGVGGYTLTFGPTSAASLSMVIEAAEHED